MHKWKLIDRSRDRIYVKHDTNNLKINAITTYYVPRYIQDIIYVWFSQHNNHTRVHDEKINGFDFLQISREPIYA